jgi:hypothetical protein
MTESKWENFGDVNPIEHGGTFVLYDNEIQGRRYYVISLSSYIDGEEKWGIIDAYIDLDDEWIEWESIKSIMETPEDADDKVLATDVMEYYGTHLTGQMLVLQPKNEVIDYLTGRGIPKELLNL